MCRGRRICENDFHLVAISKRPTPNVELSMLKSESEFDIGRWAFSVRRFLFPIANRQRKCPRRARFGRVRHWEEPA